MNSELPHEVASAAPPHLPAPLFRSLLLIAAGFVSSALLVGMSRHQPEETFTGFLAARTITLKSPLEVRVEKLLVSEGDVVATRTPLAKLVDPRQEELLSFTVRQLESQRQHLRQAKARMNVELAWRLEAVESELQAIYRQQSADQHVSAEIVPTGGAAEQLPTSAEQLYLEITRRRLDRLEQMKTELPAQLEQAFGISRLQAQILELEAAAQKLQDSEIPLQAPAYGQITNLRKSAGDTLAPGEPLALLVDHAQPQITVRVPVRILETATPGDRVSLKFSNGETREGILASIPATVPTITHQGEPSLILVVRQHGKLWPELPLGSSVQVGFSQREE